MERLDKFLTNAGVATRSQVKAILKTGRVCVDGSPVKDGAAKIDPQKQTVTLDGDVIGGRRRMVVMLNKAAGFVTSTEDPRDRTVMELLPQEYRSQDKDNQGQPGVEVEKVEKGEYQPYGHAKGRRQGVGNDGCYLVGIAYEAVHHVARVELILARPYAVHQPCKGSQLHEVLAFHAQQGAAPPACEGYGYVCKTYANEQCAPHP